MPVDFYMAKNGKWLVKKFWRNDPYDEQIIGGIVLHQGKISEMKTGEGKTLVATFQFTSMLFQEEVFM